MSKAARHRLGQAVRDRSHAVLERARHARHPLHGWRKWALIVAQSLVFLVAVFALTNLGLSLSVERRDDIGRRAGHKLTALWFSALDGRETDPAAFGRVYGRVLGDEPEAEEIRAYFEARMFDRSILLDQVMVDHMTERFGGLNSEVFPPGVYVGLRALGPDGLPFVPVTKYMAQFLFFPRHAYILVVPREGPAQVFSGSLNGHFTDDTDRPNRLAAQIADFDADAYDYPSSGQAIHELTLVSQEQGFREDALKRLTAATEELKDDDIRYGLLAPNSNTVIGCILEDAEVMTREQRASALLAVRAPGIGAACRRGLARP